MSYDSGFKPDERPTDPNKGRGVGFQPFDQLTALKDEGELSADRNDHSHLLSSSGQFLCQPKRFQIVALSR